MAQVLDVVGQKILAMKALLGDEAAKQVLAAAEERERLAQAAGVDFKDDTTPAVAPKTEPGTQESPVLLSELLAEIEDGYDQGLVEDDLGLLQEAAAEPIVEPEAKEFRTTLKQVIQETLTEMGFKAGAATAEPKDTGPVSALVKEVQDKLAASQAEQVRLKAQLDELMGLQPRLAHYRASQDPTTVTKETPPGPGPDPLNLFIDSMFGQNGGGNASPS